MLEGWQAVRAELQKGGPAEPSWDPTLPPCRPPHWPWRSVLIKVLSSSVASPLLIPAPSSLLPTPPPGPWIMSVGELENKRLVCFVSLVPVRQHHLPVMSEGLPWASLPTVARLILVFPLSLASTPTELFIERDPMPPLLGGGGKVQGWSRKAPALMPGYLCVLGGWREAVMGRLRRAKLLAWGKWSCFSLTELWDYKSSNG